MTLAATLATERVSHTINKGEPGLFMHGPTFMANPLACSAALASLNLLTEQDWQSRVNQIEAGLKASLAPCHSLDSVKEVRVLGAIGVVELHHPVDMAAIQPRFVEAGVWVRPFGKLVYVMPPYIMQSRQVQQLCEAIYQVLKQHHKPA